MYRHILFLELDCSMHLNERQIYLSSSQIVFHWVPYIMSCQCGRHLELNILSQLKCHSHLSLLPNNVCCRVATREVSRDFKIIYYGFLHVSSQLVISDITLLLNHLSISFASTFIKNQVSFSYLDYYTSLLLCFLGSRTLVPSHWTSVALLPELSSQNST